MRASEVRPAGAWTGEPADHVVLDYDGRHRRRLAMVGEAGTEFLLDLADATALAGGDALVLEDGRLIEVQAAPEKLLEVTCTDDHALLRVAWHLGNRHLPTELLPGALRIRFDHVIRDMLTGLGAEVREITAPFQPEGGAYGHGRVHGHEH